MDFPCGSAGKESICNVGELASIPGMGRSPGEGKGYPLRCSCLENSMDYSPWDRKELDVTEWLSLHTNLFSDIKPTFHPWVNGTWSWIYTVSSSTPYGYQNPWMLIIPCIRLCSIVAVLYLWFPQVWIWRVNCNSYILWIWLDSSFCVFFWEFFRSLFIRDTDL